MKTDSNDGMKIADAESASSDPSRLDYDQLELSDLDLLDQVSESFESAWENGTQPAIEELLTRVEPKLQPCLLFWLIRIELEQLGIPVEDQHSQFDVYHLRFPAMVNEIGWDNFFSSAGSGDTDNPDRSVKSVTDVEPALEVRLEPQTLLSGRYRLLDKIGQGGMGTVWRAEQLSPMKRPVAIKLIKQGIASPEFLARFDAERQALALMNHPHIAGVFDADTTRDNQPFLVMEFVAGLPLTAHCDKHRVTLPERLNLFVAVCQGVQHAHQKGIIHRDLKPSNILVSQEDGIAVPKIIDFGLAKAIEDSQRLTEMSVSTGIGQILGTFCYMSPEQAHLNSRDIDTRSDVYSLGVILYELLTGMTPLDENTIKGKGLFQILELVRRQSTLKPSQRLLEETAKQNVQSTCAVRRTDMPRLRKMLSGDLDWIVMKALDNDRSQRYETVSSMAADIQRFLNGEPVLARPPALTYRLRKYVRKHRVAVAVVSLLMITLIGGTVGTTWGLFSAIKENTAKEAALQREKQEREHAEAIAAFVRDDFLALTSVEGQWRFNDLRSITLNKDSTLLDLLNRAAEKVNGRVDIAPHTEADLQWMIGVNYRAIGQYAKAVKFLERSLDLYRQCLDDSDEQLLNSMNSLMLAYDLNGQYQQAVELGELTVELNESSFGPDSPETLLATSNLASCYSSAGQLDKAVQLSEVVVEKITSSLGVDHEWTIDTSNTLVENYRAAGQAFKALELSENLFKLCTAEFGTEHFMTLRTMILLASCRTTCGKRKEAEELLELTIEGLTAKIGRDHPDTLQCQSILASLLKSNSDLPGAIKLYQRLLDAQRRVLGPDHQQTLHTHLDLASSLCAAGRIDESLLLGQTAIESMQQKLGQDHPETLIATNDWASTLYLAGNVEVALAILEPNFAKMQRVLGPRHFNTLSAMNNLGMALAANGQLHEAIRVLEQALELRQQVLGTKHPETLHSMNNLGMKFRDDRQNGKAIALLQQTVDLSERSLGPDHADTLRYLNDLGSALWSDKQPENAIPLFERALQGKEQKWGRKNASTMTTMANLGVNYLEVGRVDDAIPLFEAVVENIEVDPTFGYIGQMLRSILVSQKRIEAFESFVDRELQSARQQYARTSPELADILAGFGRDWLAMGEQNRAIELLQESAKIGEQANIQDYAMSVTNCLLGEIYCGLGQFDRALPRLETGCQGLLQPHDNISDVERKQQLLKALDLLIDACERTNLPDKSRQYSDIRKSISAPPEPPGPPEPGGD